jgi:hypothetical protein
MILLYRGGKQPTYADAIAAHYDELLLSLCIKEKGAHLLAK